MCNVCVKALHTKSFQSLGKRVVVDPCIYGHIGWSALLPVVGVLMVAFFYTAVMCDEILVLNDREFHVGMYTEGRRYKVFAVEEVEHETT